MSVPPRQESPEWKAPPWNTSPACSEQQVPSFTSPAQFRQWCQSAGALGTVLVFCAGCPAVQLLPKAERCPDDAVRAMEERGLTGRERFRFRLGADIDGDQGPFRSGAVTGVIPSAAWTQEQLKPRTIKALPPGTQLYGQLWANTRRGDGVIGDYVIVRFERARTPDGHEFPVCLIGGDSGETPMRRTPEPDAVIFKGGANWGQVVFSWPDPCDAYEVDCKVP